MLKIMVLGLGGQKLYIILLIIGTLIIGFGVYSSVSDNNSTQQLQGQNVVGNKISNTINVPVYDKDSNKVGTIEMSKSLINYKKLETKSGITIAGVEYPDIQIEFNFDFSTSGYTIYGDFEQGIIADNNGIYLYLKTNYNEQWIVKYDHYGNLLWSYKINVWLRDIWVWQDDAYVYITGLDKNNNKFYMKIKKADGTIEDARIIYDYEQLNHRNYMAFTLMKDRETYLAMPLTLIKRDLSDYYRYTYGVSEAIIRFTDNKRIFSIYVQMDYTNGGQDFLVRIYNTDTGKVEQMYFFGTPITPDDLNKQYYQDDDLVPFWPIVYDENYGWIPIIAKTQGKDVLGEFDIMKISRSDGRIVDLTKYILPRFDVIYGSGGITLVPALYKLYNANERNMYKDVWKGCPTSQYIGGLNTGTAYMNFRIEKIYEYNDYFELVIPYWYYDNNQISTSLVLRMKVDKSSGYLYNPNTKNTLKDEPAYAIVPTQWGTFINGFYIDDYNNIYILYSQISGTKARMYLVQTSVDTISTYNIQKFVFTGTTNVTSTSDISIRKDQIVTVGG